MLRKMLLTLFLLTSVMLLASCETATSEKVTGVAPDYYEYSRDFQTQASKETTDAPACDRDKVVSGCSAVNKIVQDYHHVRCQIRVLIGVTPCKDPD